MKASCTNLMVCAGLVLGASLHCRTLQAQGAYPWQLGTTPDQFWIATQATPCDRVQGSGGVWVAQTVFAGRPSQPWTCSYVWSSTQAGAPDLNVLRASTSTLEADPPVVGTSSGADPELTAKWLEPLYNLARARFDLPEARAPYNGRTSVRVAVLDTAADTAAGLIDESGHGRAVSRVISQLACGDLQPCAAELQHTPALTLDSRQPFLLRQVQGGEGAIATRGALAAAIENVVSHWDEQRLRDNAPPRLVVNLSLGWSGCWETGRPGVGVTSDLDSSQRSLASRSVLRALARASCRGALVIAAGGNGASETACSQAHGASGTPRHTFPGLWGGSPLTAAQCASVLGGSARFQDTLPLLVGVSAVDDDDDQLAITDHEADLVAYGQAVVMPDATLSDGFTLLMSGTSVSAAAFSGAAAAVLGYRPELSNSALIALMRETAVPLRAAPDPAAPGAADFVCNDTFAAGGCKDVRRLSLCKLLAEVSSGVVCGAARKPSGFATMTPLAALHTAVDCETCGSSCPAECSQKEEPEDVASLPWVVPQPKPPACGTCALVRTGALFQAQFLYAVNSAVLKVNLPGGVTKSYSLTGADAVGTSKATWQLPASAGQAVTATLAYRASGSLAKESGDIPIKLLPVFTPGSPIVVIP
jgi:subtilisin family serine protease